MWVPKKKIKIQRKEESDVEDNDNDSYAENYNFEVATTIESVETKPSIVRAGEFAFANVESEDLDKMFLLSLLPHLKSIPEEFRLNAKMNLLQVLRVANDSTSTLKYSSIG